MDRHDPALTAPRWDVDDYATARLVLAHKGFTRTGAYREEPHPLAAHVLNLSGAEHERVRSAVDSALTRLLPVCAAAVAQWAPRLIDGLSGEVDVAAAFARPLSLVLVDTLVGLANLDEAELRWWHDAVLRLDSGAMDGIDDLLDRVNSLIDERRRRPGTDLVSALATDPHVVGAPLAATVVFAVTAGYVNTANFLALSLLALAHHPGEYSWLRAHPHGVPDAVEELLRYAEPSGRASMRVAAGNVELSDRRVAAGTTVWVHRAAANRDPRRFADPDLLDLRRGAGSLAFGAGPHYCLGAPVVRAVADVTLLALLSRVAELRPVDRTPQRWDFADPLFLRVGRRSSG